MTLLVYVLGLHFVADFVLQTPAMANGKGRSLYWLTYHVLLYSAVVTVGVQLYLWQGPLWTLWLLTFVTHWCTDFVTSRMNRRQWEYVEALRQDLDRTRHPLNRTSLQTRIGLAVHNFFVGIGADQYIHVLTLAWTLDYLGLASW